jgi:hypothetical protein
MAESVLQTISLADAIQELREDISQAVERARNEDFRFKLGTIELEFSLVATSEGSANGKLSFKILGVGAEVGAAGKLSNALTHRVKVVLTPENEGQLVSDKTKPPPA